jgi:MFS transporter, DHA2 family, multidrug resistance protein
MNGSRPRERIAVSAVLCAMALVVVDAGMVAVAVPTIGQDFGEAPSQSLLVVTAYQLALLATLLPSAHVADRIGHRRLFLVGILLFAGAALLCSIAPTFPLLVAARFLQGIGGAAVMALGIALLRTVLGPQRLAAAIGWNALVVAICSVVGPAAGVLMLSIGSWRWLFVVALPTAAAALVASRALPAVRAVGRALDLLGIMLYAAAAASLVVAVEAARSAPVAAVLLGIATLAFASWLLARERRKDAPILPLDLLALRSFRASATASVFFFTAQSAGLLALPFYLQLSLGRSATTAGLVLALWPLAVAVVSRTASLLADHFNSGSICAAGALLLAAGLAGSALVPADESIVPLAVCALISGAGFGLFQVPNNKNMFLAAPPDRSAAAGGVQGTARLTGQTAGALLVAFVLSAAPIAIAPRLTSGLAAAAALFAAWVSRQRNVTAAYQPNVSP